ncbi:MAG: hypothetical protein V4629_10765 [Pseudomonadota bacterium]
MNHNSDHVTRKEWIILALVFIALIASVVLSYTHPIWFKERWVVEDGPTEWTTVAWLLGCSLICIQRFKQTLPRTAARRIYFVMVLFFIFGAGEEVSWGQRILGIESNEFFETHNAQTETNLHNLVVGEVKINKLIFGAGFALVLMTYLLVINSFYRKHKSVKAWIDRWQIPIPKHIHTISYFVLILIVELGVSSSKRGELIEFAAPTLVWLNLWQPFNSDIFNK